MDAKQSFISNKIKKIAKEGIRRDTQAPVSSSNPRRQIPNTQRIAIAESMAKKKFGG